MIQAGGGDEAVTYFKVSICFGSMLPLAVSGRFYCARLRPLEGPVGSQLGEFNDVQLQFKNFLRLFVRSVRVIIHPGNNYCVHIMIVV